MQDGGAATVLGRKVFSGIALVVALAWGSGCAASDQPPPSILLVVLDTVRADRTSTYGHRRPTTIQMDAVARAGVVFEDVTAPAPWTYPSHASLFTGEPPWVHGAHLSAEPAEHFQGWGVSRMRDDLPTLAERLAGTGYRTVSLAANEWLSRELGVVRGFERAEVLENDAKVVQAAHAAIAAPNDEPLFLFVNLMSAHAPFREGPGRWALDDPDFLDPARAPDWVRPYLVEEEGRGVSLTGSGAPGEPVGTTRYLQGDLRIPPEDMAKLRALYDAGIRGADWALGRILERWSAAHPEGVVVVTSDHGEGFGEHGMLDHAVSVYPEVLRVPLVLAAPGRIPAGSRVRPPVRLQDLAATLLDLAEVESDARSLAPAARGGPVPGGPTVAAAWPREEWAEAVGGRFRHVWHLYREDSRALVFSDAGHQELYDLATDPAMRRDLGDRRPETLASLRERARGAFGAEAEAKPLEIPAGTRERLRALGYLDAGSPTR